MYMARTVNIKNKEAALAALLDAPTLTAAAERAGIDRRTLYNYLHDDKDFARQYKRQRELRAIEQAEAAADEREAALAAIREVMTDAGQAGAVRLKAAEKLLDIADAGMSAQRKIAGDMWDKHSGWSFD